MGFGPIVLRIVAPERDGEIIHVEWLLHINRSHGRETLASEPPRKFYYGPRTCAIVTIVIQADNNTVHLKKIKCCCVLVKRRSIGKIQPGPGARVFQYRNRPESGHRVNSSECASDSAWYWSTSWAISRAIDARA